ncbi:MAG: SGNH/GDSL hydrolase family protein [Pseudomonadota bacterium]
MRMLTLLAAAMLPALVATSATADGPDRVLFIGNSYTYYNNSLHNHYRQMVREKYPDKTQRVRINTISGGNLSEHHQGLAYLLLAEDWDVVVLQGHSLGPIDAFQRFRAAAVEHNTRIRDDGARPVLFMTWARTHRPEMTAVLRDAYVSVAKEIDAEVSPVGLAFETVTRDRPDIALRIADRSHPTLAGTYLAASVFFVRLHGELGDLDYTAGLPAETAAYLRAVAAQTVADFDNAS